MQESTGRGTGQAGYGVDEAMERRPGVPMEAPVGRGRAARPAPARQGDDPSHYRRKGLDRLTPVYGTAQPPKGLSGAMRRAAYAIPEHSAMHWAMLLSADRVDILEDRLTHGVTPGSLNATARRIRTNPLPALALVALVGFAARRALR